MMRRVSVSALMKNGSSWESVADRRSGRRIGADRNLPTRPDSSIGGSREKGKSASAGCRGSASGGGARDAHLVAAGALRLGHAASKAVHLGREDVAASGGALPVAGADVPAAASESTTPAPTAAVRVSSTAAPTAAAAAAVAAALVVILLIAAALVAPVAHCSRV